MIAIISFTDKGKSLAESIALKLSAQGLECLVNSAKRGDQENYIKTDEWAAKNFKKGNILLFVGACGIAVRAIAPFVKDKASDPAVVVMDEEAKFAISLLSGHLGGANDFARKLSGLTGAAAVVTTATDVNSLISIDSFAKDNSLEISDMLLAKDFSACLLKERKCNFVIPEEIADCIKIKGRLPQEVSLSNSCDSNGNVPNVVISPFKNTQGKNVLTLVPKCLVLGVGCRKGKPADELKEFILGELDKISVGMNAVASLCSIDLKQVEPALLSFCNDLSLPSKFFSAQGLAAVDGAFSSSPFVRDVTGVDNVCERSVFAYGAKKMILNKTKSDGMTLAVGCMEIPLSFNSRTVDHE